MTTRPRLRDPSTFVPGIVAVALFVVLSAVFLNAGFGSAVGFGGDVNITATIGYALMGLLDVAGDSAVASEGFLAAFIIVAFLLDAALEGSVLLATRDTEGGDGE
ncbi:proton-conducting membrane transporter [Halobacterium bonnevillei]|uniref:Proton-conducting membrane transporter n=1 Tax=Halobacterium bonnevillei TaxID=2692200 RepID=A0A6B0SF17_9EURY|nr:proton-conducting membrane transporter [Halobacterium bonnevillei]MXR20158.1 proton-conducting membrane transporter [Halobacterium bonnevillei]